MLGYRTFVNIAGDRSSVLDLVDEQIYSWAREKRWNADELALGGVVRLADDAEGSVVRLSTQDGSRTTRFQSVEDSGWIVRLTAHVPGASGRKPWLWVDVESPQSGTRPRAPRLVKNLFDVLDVRDGEQTLPTTVMRVDLDDVDDLIARVLDPDRRTITFVGGTTDEIPLAQWSKHVAKLTRQCSGIASTAVLDPAATTAFRAALGEAFAVDPWTVRTFMPQVDPDDPNDPVRHRYLTMQRIIEDPASRIASMLGARATTVVRELSLPREATRIDRALSKQLDDTVVGRITEVRPELRAAIRQVVTKSEPGLQPADELAPPPPPGQVVHEEVFAILTAATMELFGATRLDLDSVRALVELAAAGQQAASQQVAVRARIDQLQAEVDDLSFQALETKEQLEEERLEHEVTDLERARAEDMVRRLRKRLDADGGDPWVGPPAKDIELAPQDFAELLARMDSLTSVVFTGDADVTVGLDSHQSGRWAIKAWDAICALEDYAIAKVEGRCDRDLEGYLKDPPSGCRGFSANRFGRDESSDVKSNPRFRRARELSVPESVSPSGSIFMGAHFKLAQSGLLSPRMHCYDDTANSGKIYVGHLGPHLPTKRTN